MAIEYTNEQINESRFLWYSSDPETKDTSETTTNNIFGMADEEQRNIEDETKRKPGRPRKHDLRPCVKDTPIGFDFEKATVTTKTFTIKIENFDPDINILRKEISIKNHKNNDEHTIEKCGCKDRGYPFISPHKKGDIVDEYVLSRKNAKNAEKRENVFKNCFTVVILDNFKKPTTIKICKKGSFQLTGCQSKETGEFCILSLLYDISKLHPEWMPSTIEMTIKPVMTNVKFTIGYKISIKNALDFFEKRESFEIRGTELQNPFFSYKLRVNPAINIKKLLNKDDLHKVPMSVIKVNIKGCSVPFYKITDRTCHELSLGDYIDSLTVKEKQKHTKEKHTTLLLFRSGSVILSGIHEKIMKETFELFQEITQTYQSLIQ
jgi:hypothetical protein